MIDQLESYVEDTNYDLYFGPAHPGSGNFGVKLKIDGEKVVSVRADPGYLHRGFEKLMEFRTPIQNAVLSDRLCILEPLNWNLIHAEAVDGLMGIDVPERAKYIRVVMAELSRIQSHIIWYGVFSKGTGFDTGFKMAFGYRDYILDLFDFGIGRGSKLSDLKKLKPSAYPLERLREIVEYDKLIYVGDSEKDREFAENTGIEFIFLSRKKDEGFNSLNKVVDYLLS